MLILLLQVETNFEKADSDRGPVFLWPHFSFFLPLLFLSSPPPTGVTGQALKPLHHGCSQLFLAKCIIILNLQLDPIRLEH